MAAGEAAYERHEFARALALWQSVFASLSSNDPRCGDVLYSIGLAYLQLQRFADSLDAERRAAAIHHSAGRDGAEAGDLAVAGDALYQLGRTQESLEAHRQSLDIDRRIGNLRGEAENFVNIGILFNDAGRYDDAIAAYGAALAILAKLGDKLEEAQALTNLGVTQYRRGRLDDALASYARASEFAKAVKAVVIEADALQNVGLIQQDRGRYVEALATDARALALFRSAQDRLGAAGALNNIGIVDEKLGRYADALAADTQALALHRALGNRLGEANDLTNLGTVDQDLGKNGDALARHREALDMFRALGNRQGEAANLVDIGTLDEHVARYEDALAAFERELAIARELKSPDDEAVAHINIGNVDQDLGRFGDALDAEGQALTIVRALHYREREEVAVSDVGTVDFRLGRYDDALAAYSESLEIARALGDRRGEADALANLANVEAKLGRAGDALAGYQTALALHRAIGNRLGEAGDLNDLGETLSALGRYDEALAVHRQALALSKTLDDRLGEADNTGSIAILLGRMGRYADALEAQKQALTIQHAIGNGLGEANALTNEAATLEDLRRFPDARAAALQAAALAQRFSDPDDLWRARAVEASARAALGERSAALAAYDAALDTIEGLRAGLAGGERGTFFGGKLFVYDEYVGYLRDLDRQFPGQGYGLKALEVFERKSARASLEQIGASAAHHFAGVDPRAVAEEDAAGAALDAANARLRKLLSGRAPEDADVAAARQALASAQTHAATVATDVKARFPAYYELRHPQPLVAGCAAAPCPAGFAAFQRSVVRPGEVVLIYDLLDDSSVLWIVDKDAIRLVTLPGSKDIDAGVARLDARLAGLSTLLSSGAGARSRERIERSAAADLPGYAADSHALYQMLVPPAAVAALARARSVVVVPSGSLFRVAFETLVVDDPATAPHYLIQDVALSYIPSASLLALVRNAYARAPAGRNPLLAFANPAFGAAPPPGASDTARGVSYADLQLQAVRSTFNDGTAVSSSDAVFPALPGTQVEADAVRTALGATPASLFDGDAATRARLFELNADQVLKTYQYVLFATHAVLPGDIKGLTQPAIVLAHPERGDGLLTMADVFGLSLDADFVMLSACNTGVETAATNGDGISGLTRAFLYAGTPAISVTLWEVDDAAAPQITPSFFEGMHARGLTPAESLRQAKLALLKSPEARFRHPYAWAPGVIFGDGDRTR